MKISARIRFEKNVHFTPSFGSSPPRNTRGSNKRWSRCECHTREKIIARPWMRALFSFLILKNHENHWNAITTAQLKFLQELFSSLKTLKSFVTEQAFHMPIWCNALNKFSVISNDNCFHSKWLLPKKIDLPHVRNLIQTKYLPSAANKKTTSKKIALSWSALCTITLPSLWDLEN